MLLEQASPNYVQSAFYSQYNLILLGGSALFALASASPFPLAVGVGCELIWLGLGPRLRAFRRRVEDRSHAERRAQLDDDVMTRMRSLDAQHTSRLLTLTKVIAEIRAPGGTDLAEHDSELSAALMELEQLRPAFLNLCLLHERLSRLLQEASLQAPQQELARLSHAYAAEKDLGMRLTLRQSINLAQRKIEQQARMVDIRRTVGLKLTLIEQSVAHVRSQRLSLVSPHELLREVRELMAQLSTVSSLEAEANASVS